jgi:hypothetical protein
VAKTESQEDAFSFGILYMDIQPAVRVIICVGSEIVKSRVIDVERCQICGGIACNRDISIGRKLACTFREGMKSNKKEKTEQRSNVSHVGQVRE